jgi:hypothetical protein
VNYASVCLNQKVKQTVFSLYCMFTCFPDPIFVSCVVCEVLPACFVTL